MKINIRHERAEDAAAIHDLTKRAFASMPFAGGDEQLLPARFRSADVLALSLVAETAGSIIGQLTLTPAFAADDSPGWFALGPIAVEPNFQSQGVGSSMIAAAIDWLTANDAAGCVLVGNPAYYSRFGWLPCPALAPTGEPAEYYQILPLAIAQPHAVVCFHPLFYGDNP
jgi:putative acetyltransferase